MKINRYKSRRHDCAKEARKRSNVYTRLYLHGRQCDPESRIRAKTLAGPRWSWIFAERAHTTRQFKNYCPPARLGIVAGRRPACELRVFRFRLAYTDIAAVRNRFNFKPLEQFWCYFSQAAVELNVAHYAQCERKYLYVVNAWMSLALITCSPYYQIKVTI